MAAQKKIIAIKSENSVSNFHLPLNRPLQNYYLQEVKCGLTKIEQALAKMHNEPGDREFLVKIKGIAQSISDLAMVHGFEGVEKISGKLSSTIKHLLRAGSEFNKSLIAKVNMTVKAMQQVAEMESYIEKQMTVERIDRTVEINQKKVQNCAEKISQSIDDLIHDQSNSASDEDESHLDRIVTIPDSEIEKEPDLLFDICELDSVMNLTEDTPLSNSENSPADSFSSNDLHDIEVEG
ncbi:MAG: hypothetical protein ACE5HI_09460 [bacterium]